MSASERSRVREARGSHWECYVSLIPTIEEDRARGVVGGRLPVVLVHVVTQGEGAWLGGVVIEMIDDRVEVVLLHRVHGGGLVW